MYLSLKERGNTLNKLAMWRGRKQMTLQELAAASKVNKATIIRIEQEQVKPNVSTLGKLAAALGIDITELSDLTQISPKSQAA